MRILRSIPGIGAVCASTILIEMPEIGSMDRKQVASLTGLAPMTRRSGQWRGKSFIQGGRKVVRNALYMPALVAMRHNPDLRAKYQALIKAGKPPKVALTALMRKLIARQRPHQSKSKLGEKSGLIKTDTLHWRGKGGCGETRAGEYQRGSDRLSSPEN